MTAPTRAAKVQHLMCARANLVNDTSRRNAIRQLLERLTPWAQWTTTPSPQQRGVPQKFVRLKLGLARRAWPRLRASSIMPAAFCHAAPWANDHAG